MFRGWNFLLGEIWVLIALAALLGLVVGWLIWGRSAAPAAAVEDSEARRLRAELEACRAKAAAAEDRVAAMERELEAVQQTAAAVELTAPPAAVAAAEVAPARPARLEAPRGGVPDDLKRIKGVGPKLEALLNRLGFWHFDQIANWTAAEVAWVDENLETFKGRVTRDDWVTQARQLAAEKKA